MTHKDNVFMNEEFQITLHLHRGGDRLKMIFVCTEEKTSCSGGDKGSIFEISIGSCKTHGTPNCERWRLAIHKWQSGSLTG